MAAVGDGDGQLAQALQGRDIVVDIRTLEGIEQRPVVDRIAGEQYPGGGLPLVSVLKFPVIKNG